MLALKSSDFYKNVFTLITGNSIAQLIAIAIAPVLTRLYTPEDFGFFGLFFSIVGGISVIISARYDLAIVLPKSDDKALKLVFLSFLICILISVVSFIVVISILFIQPGYSKWFLLIPLFALIIGFYQILINWNNRKKKYKKIALNRISNSLTGNTTTLLLGFLKAGYPGLILGNLAGQIVSLVILFRDEFSVMLKQFRKLTFGEIRQTAHEFSDMPRINTFQALIDLFQLNGIIYLIPVFFNSVVLGLYSLCLRIMQVPVNLVGAAISQVFFQKAAEIYNSGGNLNYHVKETIVKSALLCAPVPLILIPAGPMLFAFVFGEAWREAGEFARYLAPYLYLDFIRLTISQLPIVIGEQKKMTALSIIGNIILLGAVLYAGIFSGSLKTGIIIYSLASSVLMIIIILWIYKKSFSIKKNADTE